MQKKHKKNSVRVNGKDASVLNMQLRVACIDGQIHAVRYLLEEGSNPFHIDPYDDKTPVMVAAQHNNPDIIAILLIFAEKNIDSKITEEGLRSRDRDGATAAQIAIANNNVTCLSVLLYLHPNLAEVGEDFDGHHSLIDVVAGLSSSKQKDILEFFNIHYPLLVKEILLANTKQKISGEKKPLIDNDYCSTLMSSFSTKIRDFSIILLRILTAVPKSLVFISMRIYIFYSVYMLVVSTGNNGLDLFAAVLNIVGTFSVMFLWSLYSKLCTKSPGCIIKMKSIAREHFSPSAELLNSFSNTVDDIERANFQALRPSKRTREEKNIGVNSYDEALDVLFSSSDIARKSHVELAKRLSCGNNPSNYKSCCHYCRGMQPFRCKHSRTLKKCVPNYDHYCIFLGNHVGRDNYPYYVSSLVIAVTMVLPLFISNFFSYTNTNPILSWDESFMVNNTIIDMSLRNIVTFFDKPMSHTFAISITFFLQELGYLSFYLQRILFYFLIWCAVWWIPFFLLLCVHIYLMCFNLTTLEYVIWFEKGHHNKEHVNLFSRKTCLHNIRDRLFPINNDVCFTKRDAEKLLDRPILPFNHYWVRFIDAFVDILISNYKFHSYEKNL